MKRALLWGAGVLFVGLLALGLARLRLDVEVLNLLPQQVPVVQGLKLYQKHFADGRELILTLNGPSAESTETAARFCAEALKGASNLIGRAVWQAPFQEHPEHMPELIAFMWLNQSPEVIGQLTNRLAGGLEKELAGAREDLATTLSPTDIARLAYDPLGLTRLPGTDGPSSLMGQDQDLFSGDDGKFRIVFAEPKTELKSYKKAAAWMGEIHKVIEERRARPDWPRELTVGYTGGPAFLAETGTRMQSDMQGSSFGTLAIVAGLFWWAHRRLAPLLCQTGLIVLVVAGTMALGGLVFGTLSIISLGFAAILMGLADDFGLILYQEWTAMPSASSAQVRKLLSSGIGWSAVTTAGAFALLNMCGLPGLSQLGSLVAMGILLAAVVMLFAFLPLARKGAPKPTAPVEAQSPHETPKAFRPAPANRAIWIGTAAAGIFVLAVLATGLPKVDHGITALQLTDCAAQNALDDLQDKMNRKGKPFMLVFSGADEGEVARELKSVSEKLETWQNDGRINQFILPTMMWPNPERQRANRAILGQLAEGRERLWTAVQRAGFTSDAFALCDEVFKHWQTWAPRTDVIWPVNSSCQWLQKRFAAHRDEGWLALGTFSASDEGRFSEWQKEMTALPKGVWMTSWSLLGESLLEHVQARMGWMMAAIAGVLALCLWLAFRSTWEAGLSFLTLGVSGLAVLAVMRLAGWSWNMMNFMALPLWVGVGVDYTIHVQLALRRSGGNAGEMRKVTGKALFLCAGTTIAGFGSLAWSSSEGLSSLGLLCSIGVLCVLLVSIYLLPEWWKFFAKRTAAKVNGTGAAAPPGIYRAGLWKAAMVLARVLPDRVLFGLCRIGGGLYYRTQKERVEVLVQNLLPVCGERAKTEAVVRRLFGNFAVKLANLWKFEAGVTANNWITAPEEWAIIQAAQKRGQGILFVTLHLGDWEHGGLLLAQLGIKLMVLTLAEPGAKFTEVRTASRARWGIETLVIGEDSFAFVEVIKRLQDGGAVALSIDRPPARGAVPVEFFGRQFMASNAVADLARASGCSVLGVVIARHGDGLRVRVLPEFVYDRQKLGDREARRQMTQEILRAFEPEIREHLDQWYQFVPIWGKTDAP